MYNRKKNWSTAEMDWQPNYSVVFQSFSVPEEAIFYVYLTSMTPQSWRVIYTLSDTGRIFSLNNASLNISFSIPCCVAILSPVFNPKDVHRLRGTNGLSTVGITGDIQFSPMGFFYMSKWCKTTLGFPVTALYLMLFSFCHYLKFPIHYS